MQITKKIAALAVLCKAAAANVCKSKEYSILQGSTDRVFVDPYINRFWPKDSAGISNIDPICPAGYTCMPNYIPPVKKLPGLKALKSTLMKNIKYRAKAYNPITTPGGGCLGLEMYDSVGIQSMHNGLYLARCKNCFNARYKNMAMVYSSFKNPDSKWKFINVGGKCAIKNVKTGKYLSECNRCTGSISVSLLALYRGDVNDRKNTELWEVNRKKDKSYVFRSASSGKLLSICDNCLSESASITSPASLFMTGPDNSFVKWRVWVSR